jgi:hypothetical protein
VTAVGLSSLTVPYMADVVGNAAVSVTVEIQSEQMRRAPNGACRDVVIGGSRSWSRLVPVMLLLLLACVRC